MATIKLTIDSRRRYEDGRFAIIFRITSKVQSTYINTGLKLFHKEWDSSKGRVNKTHQDHKTLNLMLKDRQLEYEKCLLLLDLEKVTMPIQEIKLRLLNGNKPIQTTFWSFAQKEIQALRVQGRYGNAQAYETAVNRFVKYSGKEITMEKIDYSAIADFDHQLRSEGLRTNGISAYLRAIRTLLNKATKRGLITNPSYPFASFRIKTEKTVNRAIPKKELMKLWDQPLKENTAIWHSRNIFFLIFNLIGISFIDLGLLTHSSIQGERIVYKRRKTGKIYSIRITSEAKKLLALYKSEESQFLISCFKLDGIPKSSEREEVALRLKTYNKYLKRLGKLCELPITLTTYVARYSWANIAKSLGYSKDVIAEALGHEYGNRITGIYLDNYGDEVIDEMNEVVCRAVMSNKIVSGL